MTLTTPTPATGASPAQRYLEALFALAGERGLASVILFGSVARGGFAAGVSDVDSILVVEDRTTPDARKQLAAEVTRLEIAHGLRAPSRGGQSRLERFAERSGGNALSSFTCTRSDLLSGDVARILGLRAAEALFVDRIVLAGIIQSAVTAWGDDLLPRVPVPPIRRRDVFKALFSFLSQIQLSLAAYAVLPDATKYAMGALKRALHSCYFCWTGRTAPLEEEIAFFADIAGPRATRTFDELLRLRARYRRSLAFVVRCLPVVVGLHWRTAWQRRFPIRVTRTAESSVG